MFLRIARRRRTSITVRHEVNVISARSVEGFAVQTPRGALRVSRRGDVRCSPSNRAGNLNSSALHAVECAGNSRERELPAKPPQFPASTFESALLLREAP